MHIPFCSQACDYCDFPSKVPPRKEWMARYLRALSKEIRSGLSKLSPLNSLYFGGGTPSLLSVDDLANLLDAFSPRLMPHTEITLEANPEDVTPEKAHAWKQLNCNRVSLGWQTMDAQALAYIGRKGDPHTNQAALSALRAAGLENVSVDWILGIPGDATGCLATICALRPTHVSVYTLTLEPATKLAHRAKLGSFQGLPERSLMHAYWQAVDQLEAWGYTRYETSSLALEEQFQSRHNLAYWNRSYYAGFGMGASGFENSPRGELRYSHSPNWKRYCEAIEQDQHPYVAEEILSAATAEREHVLLGLRKQSGLTHVHPSLREAALTCPKWFQVDEESIRLTRLGHNLMNQAVLYLWEALPAD